MVSFASRVSAVTAPLLLRTLGCPVLESSPLSWSSRLRFPATFLVLEVAYAFAISAAVGSELVGLIHS